MIQNTSITIADKKIKTLHSNVKKYNVIRVPIINGHPIKITNLIKSVRILKISDIIIFKFI